MPCNGGYMRSSGNAEDRVLIDKLTRMLCDVLGNEGLVIDLSKETYQWWQEHKAEDKRREELEAKCVAASEERDRQREGTLENEYQTWISFPCSFPVLWKAKK